MNLTLFRREQCSLCEHAEEALRAAGVQGFERVDVGWRGSNAERYGLRVPVLRREDSGAELEWPFDAWSVRQFVAKPGG
jgi:Glutaredoxin-like domain (DUF836)